MLPVRASSSSSSSFGDADCHRIGLSLVLSAGFVWSPPYGTPESFLLQSPMLGAECRPNQGRSRSRKQNSSDKSVVAPDGIAWNIQSAFHSQPRDHCIAACPRPPPLADGELALRLAVRRTAIPAGTSAYGVVRRPAFRTLPADSPTPRVPFPWWATSVATCLACFCLRLLSTSSITLMPHVRNNYRTYHVLDLLRTLLDRRPERC